MSTRHHLMGVCSLLELFDHDHKLLGFVPYNLRVVDWRCIPFNATWIVEVSNGVLVWFGSTVLLIVAVDIHWPFFCTYSHAV